MKIQQEDNYESKKDSAIWSIIRDISKNRRQEEAFYVCNLNEVMEKHKQWLTFMPTVVPYYAVKCNDDITILRLLAALGTRFDCASRAEIAKVLSIGVTPDRIIFANPAKPKSHIRFAASVGISTMTFDNESELHKIQELYPGAKLVLRIRVDAVNAQCPLGMKFGCNPTKEAPKLLQLANELNLNVVGISFHVGSGCRDAPVFERAICAAKQLFDYGETLGFKMSLLDIGGGYPGVQGSSITEIANVVNNALAVYFPEPNIQVIAEPGRFYVASAYTLACNIHSIRKVTNDDDIETHRMYYINDGVYGSFNCILYDHQQVNAIPLKNYPESGMRKSSSVWGPTCDGLDQVLDDVLLPEMEIGDWLVFEDMGAYTLPVASAFNGFPVPRVHYAINQSDWIHFHNIAELPNNIFKIPDEISPMSRLIRRMSECTDQALAAEPHKFNINSPNILVG